MESASKKRFCSQTDIGVSSAVISYNDGASRLIDVFNLIEIKSGTFCEHYCIQRKMELRAIQKGFADTAEEQEGLVYGAGLL